MNLPTILVLCAVIALVALVIFKMIRDKKQGKHSCSCGCGGCPFSDTCHSTTK